MRPLAIVTGASSSAARATWWSGWNNKLQSGIANVIPGGMTAEMRRRTAEPGTARKYAEASTCESHLWGGAALPRRKLPQSDREGHENEKTHVDVHMTGHDVGILMAVRSRNEQSDQ